MQFSIIVPVYNIENYIIQCIDSVLSQNFLDYELLLVDDGSTDSSGRICDRYAQMDYHIKVIHTKNGGPSVARNNGIVTAAGDFILFLDGDDYWCKNTMLSELSKYIRQTNSDIVVFGAKSLIEDEKGTYTTNKDMNILIRAKKGYMPEDFLRTHLKKNFYYEWYPWLYTFRKKLFTDHCLYFPVGRKYEDPYLIWRLLLRADKIGVFPEKYYIYRRNRPGATTNMFTRQSLGDFLWVIEDNINTLNNLDISSDVKKLLADNFSKSYFVCCIGATLLDKEEKRQYTQELQEKKYIMDYAVSPKYVWITKAAKVIGFNSMIVIFGLRRKLKGKVKKMWTKK